jgi:hypothetical protein
LEQNEEIHSLLATGTQDILYPAACAHIRTMGYPNGMS